MENQDAAPQAAWKDKNESAFTIIDLGLSDNLLYHLDLTKTAREVWTNLEGIFVNNSKWFLKMQLYSMTDQASDTLKQHLDALNLLLQKLTTLKCSLDNDDKKAVLNSLIDEERFRDTVWALKVRMRNDL